MDADAIGTGHRLGREHSVDDRLLGRLDRRREQCVDARRSAASSRSPPAPDPPHPGWPSEKAIIRSPESLWPRPPTSANAQRRAPREPLELVRQKRRIGRDDDDDRAAPCRAYRLSRGFAALAPQRVAQPCARWRRLGRVARHQVRDLPPDGDAGDGEIAPPPVIALAPARRRCRPPSAAARARARRCRSRP